MSHLDRFVPEPRLREVNHVDVGVPLVRAHDLVRHLDLASSALVRALFVLRTIPSRARGETPPRESLRLDDIGAAGTGFQIFVDEPTSFLVGSVGRFWESDIPFRTVPAQDFGAFEEPGWGKLAWEIRFEARGDHATRITVEVRVTAGDDAAWQKFRHYFALIGPFSRFIRRHVLELVVRRLGTPEADELVRALPGDDLLPNAKAQVTQGITINAKPETIWPWLVQMGCGRGGWYSYDLFDNGGEPSARRIEHELQSLTVGDELAATPDGPEGFIVERIDPERCLLLRGLFDTEAERRVLPGESRPARFIEVAWAFVLEPLDSETTRLIARVRADLVPDRKLLRTLQTRIVHRVMEARQLENIRCRAEGQLRKHATTAGDVSEGLVGALGMAFDFGTPFLRGARSHWGLAKEDAERVYPGDDIVPQPNWSWTHAVEINAGAARVWPWIVQMGQDKAGFYSYQWLENLVGCDLENADKVHPEWQSLGVGDPFRLHPKAPPLTVASIAAGRHLIVSSPTTVAQASERGEDFVAVSWGLFVEALAGDRCRFISRYRVAHGSGIRGRLAYGPSFAESVGFIMDRRMLLGVKQRAEAGELV